ncbi:hypothetical protein JAAARDRAFT_39186 [Jaapia argillacea MUCL 33604]|uniref:Enoyl reductase (ER) domain-containing protein n=1 Tax=Jaapia argillacea MUCL 33604 TaxID=933084 RepID=A0A067PT35_9AGAM|nr:hypothetical protein JAAARDRAFT_39186 [Jaapia argillacea MUCL 33604]
MRAFVVKEHAHPSKISVAFDFPQPTPQRPDEVLVDVFSAGLNFFDLLQAQGKYQNQPPMPFVLGSEFAGLVASNSPIPKGCPFKPGDRVLGGGQGAFGETVAVPWKNLLPLPDNLSFDQAAGLFVTWPTSYEALVGRAELKPGEWVLVTASAGGVGIAAVQLAKALGAKVIAAAGSQAKLDISKRYGGADFCIDYTKPGWQNEVLNITGGKGVDVIYDPVGMIRDSLKCIAWKGRALVVGFAAGQIEKLPLNLVLLKNISIVGIHWGAYSKKEPQRAVVVWKELFELLASERVKPVVYSQIYPLERLADGLVAIEKRQTWGKAVVRIRDEATGQKAKL